MGDSCSKIGSCSKLGLKGHFHFCHSSSSEDLVASNHEALLCANSCLRILKAVLSYVRRDSTLVYDCLDAIEMCTAVLTTENDQNGMEHEVPNPITTVEDVLQLVKTWLKNALQHAIPCYNETVKHEELKVCICYFQCALVSEEEHFPY